MKKIWWILLALISLWSCGGVDKGECVVKPDVSSIDLTVEIEHFQDSLTKMTSKKELIAFFGKQPAIRDYIFRRPEYPDDSAFVNALFQRFTNPHFDTLVAATNNTFGDLSDLRTQFTEAFTNIKYYYPDFVPPKIQTIVSGLDTDLLVSDSLIIVSLDFYLGKGAAYRPKIYEYLLRRYEPEDIVPSWLLISGIDGRLNKTDLTDKTVLAEMTAYGKSFYFAKHMLPCVPDSVFLWYTEPEMIGARENEDLIWARFIQDKVLFSTSMLDKRNYLGERPFTIQVGEKCPGRIGQWVGWMIVNQYMKSHPETTLPQLMAISDSQKLFKDSNYKPKRR